jgi:hypothetical protein
MRSSCQEVAQQARAASLSHEDYLLTLVDQELDVRRQGRIAPEMRASPKVHGSFPRPHLTKMMPTKWQSLSGRTAARPSATNH